MKSAIMETITVVVHESMIASPCKKSFDMIITSTLGLLSC